MVKRLLPVLAVGAVALTAHAAWNRRILRRPTPVDADITESIAVHIPARNEADALGDALASVQRCDGERSRGQGCCAFWPAREGSWAGGDLRSSDGHCEQVLLERS